MYIVSFPVPQPIDTRVVHVSAVALGLVLEPDPRSGLIPRPPRTNVLSNIQVLYDLEWASVS